MSSTAFNFRAIGFLAVVFAALGTTTAIAQNVRYSISNEFRYGIGEQFEQDRFATKEYLENMFNSRLYLGDFRLGFRVQIDKPREFGRDTIGIKEYFAEFVKDGLHARGGTFYDLVGQGLVFNTFESRPIGFDTQTEGVKLAYETTEFAGAAFGGIMHYADILGTNRLEEYLIRGGHGEVRPIDEVSIGGSFVSATGQKTREGFRNEFDAYLREGFIEANYEGFNAILNVADKRTQLDSLSRATTSSDAYGTGWYSKLSYTGSLFGIIGEYKNYRFDLVEPDERDVGTRSTRALPFQNAPSLIPEHDKTLLARNPHAIDFNDELGFQVEALIYPTDELTFNILGSAGSRHNGWQADWVVDPTTEEGSTEYSLINDAPLSFPELSDIRYSPYWELFLHGDYQMSDEVNFAAGFQRKSNILYFEGDGNTLTPKFDEYDASTILLESITDIGQSNSLHAILELQKVYDSKHETAGIDSLGIEPSDGHFNNALLTLEFSHSPTWAINGRLEWTSAVNEEEGRKLWPVVGATYRIGRSHTIGAQYGAERGGVVCTGGVCRFINPFTGFRLTVVSKL